MAYHVHVITASFFGLLPRLLPAPQAFLRPIRPSRLPPNTDVETVGVESGNVRCHLNYFADLLHEVDQRKGYTLQEVHVRHNNSHPSRTIKPKILGPTGILSIFGMLLSVGLVFFALFIGDGTAVFAVGLLALTSTLTGIGSFVLVHCTEEVARELYFGQESCEYALNDTWFRITAGAGTFTLIAAVVFLANCKWELQATIAVVYIALNSFYWFAAVLPQSWGWGLSVYKVDVKDDVDADSYTGVLTEITKHWSRWLDIAEARHMDPEWDGPAELVELMKIDVDAPTSEQGGAGSDC
ncbi:hypothetical protein K440DRAFT_644355 [Wilcoxina mikolae CBS 423.85]|nr:hypothetical protein K440DRAFT_644355 [Wilcoxina mikolae CBS 423.85]